MQAKDIKDRDSLLIWLGGRSADESVAMATRAALRAVPFLPGAGWVGQRPRQSAPSLVLIWRALSVAWVYARYPAASSSYEFRKAVTAAAHAGDATVRSARPVAPDPFGQHAADAAVFAALAASAAASKHDFTVAEPSSIATVRTAGVFAELNARSGAARSAAAAVAAAADAIGASLWMNVAADAEAMETGTSPSTLMASALWQSAMSEVISFKLNDQGLAYGLRSDEHWQVWTRWYGSRLNGEAGNEAEEIARIVEVAEEEWQAGPAVANKKIKDILARFRDPPPEPVPEPAPEPAPQPIPTPPPRLTIGPRLRATADGRLDLEPVAPPAVPISQRRAAVAEVAQDLLDQCGGNDSQHFVVPLQRLIDALTAEDTSVPRLHLRMSRLVGLAAMDHQRGETLAADRMADIGPVLDDLRRSVLDLLLEGLNGLYVHDRELQAERDVLNDPDSVAAAQSAASSNTALLQDLARTPAALTDAARSEINEIVAAALPELPGTAPSPAVAVEVALAVQIAAVEAASLAASLAVSQRHEEREEERLRIDKARLEIEKAALNPLRKVGDGVLLAIGAKIGDAIAQFALSVIGWLTNNYHQILSSLGSNPLAKQAYDYIVSVFDKGPPTS